MGTRGSKYQPIKRKKPNTVIRAPRLYPNPSYTPTLSVHVYSNRYLSAVRVLRVDERFVLFEELFARRVHTRFRQRVRRETDHFRFHDAVLVQRNDHFLHLAEDQVQLRVDVERF